MNLIFNLLGPVLYFILMYIYLKNKRNQIDDLKSDDITKDLLRRKLKKKLITITLIYVSTLFIQHYFSK